MKPRRKRSLSIYFLYLAFTACATTSLYGAPPLATPRGVVLEEVGRGSALDQAGLRPGDLVLAWERPPDLPAPPEAGGGEIRTAFDWLRVMAEQAPRGAVRLHGRRQSAAVLFDVPRGLWEARARPSMSEGLLETWNAGRRRVEAGDLEPGIALWTGLLDSAEVEAAPGLRSWLLLQIGEAWSKGRQGDKARAALQEALPHAQDAATRVAVWEALGESYQYANQMRPAEASFRSAVEAGETAWGDSLQVAGTISRLGNVVRLQDRPEEAAKLHGRALEIRQRLAPDSLEVTESLHQLSLVAWDLRDLEALAEHLGRALAIHQRWPPDTLAMVDTLNDLANLEIGRGRFAEAAAASQRVLLILEQRAPESLVMATSLARLGFYARVLGETDTALELLERALAMRQRLAPESLGNAAILANLGLIAQERGDLAAATAFFRRTLAMWEKAAPQGLGVSGSQDALGLIAWLRGDLDEAWNLLRQSTEIRERIVPGGVDMAESLGHLGTVAEARGELDLALDLYQRSQAIYERLAPGTIEAASALHQLGQLHRRWRRPSQAAPYLTRAVEALESQVRRLGDSRELQASFRARHEKIYRDAIEFELERGHAAQAFHLVERSRARSFLTLLAERDLAFAGELPAALERSRRDNAARYDQTLRELARSTLAAGEKASEELRRKLDRLRWERAAIGAEIRRAAPRLAALREPQPLDLSAARNVLEPGTTALSYSVGKDRTALFAVTREGGLRVEILPWGEERLRRDVERFLERVRSQEAPADLSRALYRALIAPVADLVERSERLLILPDGPLHRLPFGALLRDPPGAAPGRGQYLVEWKPLHTALSLTVYGMLRAPGGGAPGGGASGGGASGGVPPRPAAAGEATRLVAFGDPLYPQAPLPAGGAGSPLRRPLGLGLRSFDWAALPHTRREVESLVEVYPGARLYLGRDATEERAKSVGRDARILHFATHARVDDRTPLDSALALTIPEELSAGRDNGLLQVWEIFESVRLDADLVVLSACDSALGRELSGEGLIGLTRAFQYAGARSVVASLWSVTDQVTAELMVRFHRHLAAGMPKDEALRAAQIELLRRPVRLTTAQGHAWETDASAPFFWAAFQLFGDWR